MGKLGIQLELQLTAMQLWRFKLENVTHPSTNRTRRRITTLIETNALPLHQTTSGFK